MHLPNKIIHLWKKFYVNDFLDADPDFNISLGIINPSSDKKTSKATIREKAFCRALNAEIYRIGTSSNFYGTQRLMIYILRWEERLIPFIANLDNRITKKQDDTGWTTEISCITITHIGKDLKALPNDREQLTRYLTSIFEEDKSSHSYEFKSLAEFKSTIRLIQEGLPLLLYNHSYGQKCRSIVPAEILFDAGPWNINGKWQYQKEREIREKSFNSKFYRARSIVMKLQIAASNGTPLLDTETLIEKLKNKQFSAKQTYDYVGGFSDNNKKIVREWHREFSKKVVTPEQFMNFLEKHPPKRKTGHGGVSIHELTQETKIKDKFISDILVEFPSPLQKFINYWDNLKEEAIILSNQYNKKITHIIKQDTEIKEPNKEDIFAIETALKKLMKNYDVELLEEPELMRSLEKLYAQHLSSFWPNSDIFMKDLKELIAKRSEGKGDLL